MPTAPPANGGSPGSGAARWRATASAASAYGIAGVAERPAQHLARADADERVAPEAALLGRLEQERGMAGLAELQERRHRRLGVEHVRLADRDQRVARRPARGPARGVGVAAAPQRLATAIEHPLGLAGARARGRAAAPPGGRARRRPPRPRARRDSSRAARATSSASSWTFSPISPARRAAGRCRSPRVARPRARRSSARAPAAPRAARPARARRGESRCARRCGRPARPARRAPAARRRRSRPAAPRRASVLPEVAPLCHSSCRLRLKKCSSPVRRVAASASAFM